MAISYIDDTNNYPHIAFLDQNGSHLTGSPLLISNNTQYNQITNCQYSDNSILIIMANTVDTTNFSHYIKISYTRNFLFFLFIKRKFE